MTLSISHWLLAGCALLPVVLRAQEEDTFETIVRREKGNNCGLTLQSMIRSYHSRPWGGHLAFFRALADSYWARAVCTVLCCDSLYLQLRLFR
jgi:hypothetical protein